MPTIEVGCAIIFAPAANSKNSGKILIAQRKPDDHLGGYWEFPGGKREKDETMEECLVREAYEELGVQVRPRRLLCKKDHIYPEKILSLHFYFCDWISGDPAKRDCHDFRWILIEELDSFQFPPADADIIRELITNKAAYFSH